MESEERPAKMRKLEHEENADIILNDEVPTTTATVDESNPVTTESSDTVAATGETPVANAEEPKISKNQLKKKRRLEQWEAGREDRKVKRKEKAKERKERKRETWKEQNTDENGNVLPMPPSRLPRHFSGFGAQVPITIIFDCDFEDLMYDAELKSLGLQITRCYSDNRKAKYKTHLALSSFGGKMKERFDGILAKQYTNWKGFRFFEEDFVAVAEKAKEWMVAPNDDEDIGALRRPSEGSAEGKEPQAGDADEEGEIVYLSAESDNVLTHLKPNSTYIIGGLVDKNRHKGICHKRAVNRNIKTAKLPIGEYLEMRDRKVLVTNHVLEILLKWMEYDDWGKAFMEVMPKRKGFKLREDGEREEAESNTGTQNGDEQDEQEMEDAAKEAVEEAEGTTNVAETEIIETTKGLPVGETAAD
ncbi:tRNA methyltransferase [Parastagonospora nodorum]|nr:tRNA methyltransferase [Parastagonospora nodorum]KAH4058813.1 tRNA methyltransferase [Parastagonospora nodorum]KAH4078909.1 tRNA methyltransferase [Parastagonospora nodorum]KAH4113818.1 tRNA methyltransferase [Parastagonospora nodorum]KAH5195271.1 tRNA methyltransferase [Parastagonospora nodorum]